VAAGSILEQAVGEPDRPLDPEELPEDRLAGRPGDARVPVRVEDRRLERDQRPFAVGADR